MTGRVVGHFEIRESLGHGGMGVVYKAHDRHLDRLVAIKVLRPETVSDPERKRRFVLEAKLASSLNHPNIVTIYDIAEADGTDYIAMEYVPGRTLDQLIGRHGLGLNEALKYATQIAGALARAHKAGIIHRDLKPSNVIVGEGGIVKVLDFGLAKLAGGTDGDLAATMSVNAVPKTEEGTIVGTAAYMSPEQASGRELDARSDIFSFGTMLYETLTGTRPFQGENKISTLSAILHKDPRPVSELAPDMPQELARLIERCLRKDPERRIQHMADIKVTLEDLREESESGKQPAAVAKPRRSWRDPLLALVAVAVVAVGVVGWMRTRPAAPAAEPRLRRLTADSGLTTDPAISPDGKLVAFASDRAGEGSLDIWVAQVSGGLPVRLTTHEAEDSQPTFSPDGSQIAFRSGRDGAGIYVAPTLGGEARLIVPGGYRPRFSPDGKLILYWDGAFGNFLPARSYVVSPNGGAPRRIRADFARAGYPVWSPDGKHILFGSTSCLKVHGSSTPIFNRSTTGGLRRWTAASRCARVRQRSFDERGCPDEYQKHGRRAACSLHWWAATRRASR